MTSNAPDTPTISKTRSLSPVWLIPIAAVLIALGLAVQAWQEKGPVVEITFLDAAGITPGKTRILFKNVDVGLVQQVHLSQDLSRVVVTARLNPEMADYLYQDTRFWVVTPRISYSGISGLDTLFSGVYIEMDPGKTGKIQDRFTGLEEAAPVRSNDQGRTYRLLSDSLNSIDIGSPVYHRQVKVGEVVSYRLSAEQEQVEIQVFVESPFHKLVKQSSHFWNVSGLGVELTAEGFNARLESIAALISGGVAFDTPALGLTSEPASEEQSFHLYPNESAVTDGLFRANHFYRLRFHDSVRGLTTGAPVELLGIKVGEVVRVGFDTVDADKQDIEVIIALQPARLSFADNLSKTELDGRLNAMIGHGLRAQLKTGSLLTGKLYVDLVNEGGEPAQLIATADYSEIPTSATEYKQLARQLSNIVAKVDQLPLEEIGANLNDSLASIQKTLRELEQVQIATKLDHTLSNLESSSVSIEQFVETASKAVIDLRQTLQSLERTVAPDSPLYYKVLQMADQVGDAAKSLEQLTSKLNRYPQSLLLGHGEPE